MKNLIKVLATTFLLSMYSCVVQRPMEAQQGDVTFQVFYDQLSPYGEWANNTDYGYIWIPDAGPDFSPYSTNGYWVMTDYGWTWFSDYKWGWAPFHYGRWDYDNYYGWFWVPDNEWGPSWVVWRRTDNYYGWAPMRPGISVNLSFGNDYRDVDRWNFVRYSDFGRRDMQRYYVNRRDNDAIIRNSVVINNTYVDTRRNGTYIAGPQRDEVQRNTGRVVRNIPISDDDRPGQRITNNQYRIYRPQVEKSNNNNQRSAPSRVIEIKDVRPPDERNSRQQRNTSTPVQNRRRDTQEGQSQQQRQSGGNVQSRQTMPPQKTETVKQDDQQKAVTPPQQNEMQRKEVNSSNKRQRREAKSSDGSNSNKKEESTTTSRRIKREKKDN